MIVVLVFIQHIKESCSKQFWIRKLKIQNLKRGN